MPSLAMASPPHPTTDRDNFDPDHQPPLPFKAAEDYARNVMRWAREPLPATVMATWDVAYGTHRLHRYNVFAPQDAQGAPVLVFWHGGGWTNGYRDYVTFMAEHVVRLGIVLIAPSYRLVHHARLPAALEDCYALLNHLADHAGTHGADANRIYLGGHSAGGHLAALTALRYPRSRDGKLAPDALRGCLPISGIMDLHHPDPDPSSLEERVYTAVLTNPDEDAALSPLCWTGGNRIPFTMTFGARDSTRVQTSNRRMAALMRLQEAPVQLHTEADTDHFATHTMLREGGHPWYGRLVQLEKETRP